MNLPFKQDTRMGRLATVLGKDALNLLRFDGEEQLNGLFTFRIEALANTAGLDLNDLIGTHATVAIRNFDQDETAFDGIVTEAEFLGVGENGWRYNLTLRPWLHLASLRRKQQIFHNKSVVDILDDVFAPYAALGAPAVEKRLSSSYAPLEYTVQYRESDLNFATRLMERFGISYHFTHAQGSHTLVLTDQITAHRPLPGGSRRFQIVGDRHRAGVEHFWEMRPARRLTTGKIRLTDYNFKSPDAAMETERDGAATSAEGHLESYDYPGDYLTQGEGRGVALLRMDQERGQDQRHRATGDCVTLRAGLLVTVTGDAVAGVGKSLCLVAHHRYISAGYGSTSADSPLSDAQFLLMPADAPLAPERKTRVPVVHGPQTARVVGAGEIDCDEYGRILVRFHWDLDDRFSMRCRVSQNWAGKGWGGIVIPRVGMEVVVEFLEGDPDKPLVTGCVYNGKNEVPYKLPENKTISTFKSDTHQGEGFNELRFEDAAGKEEIFIHGQRDRNTKIENNQSERINVNKVESVGHDKASEIENNLLQVVDGNMDLRIGPGNRNSVTPAGAKDFTEGLPQIPSRFGGVGSNAGTGDLKISVEQNKLQSIGANHDESVTGHKTSDVKKNYTLHVGREIEIVAGDRIILNCGQSRVVLEDNGTITVNAKKVQVSADQLISLLADMVKIN